MGGIFAEINAPAVAIILAGAMFAAWSVGRWIGRKLRGAPSDARTTRFHDASLALLGLLLGFTFSMSLGKHEQRRLTVVADADAIGDFYTYATLLDDPLRSQLQAVIREYTTLRLRGTHQLLYEEGMLAQFGQIQARMTALVGEAVRQRTPIATPLVNTLNGVTGTHAARVAALHDRLPTRTVLLLFFVALVAMALVGLEYAQVSGPQLAGAVGFIIVVSLTVYAILDLNQPTRGSIRVSEEPMERLLQSMTR
jgi:hypothetical protein